MHIGVIGTGYVGLVVGTCLAEWGHQVICVDQDQSKVQSLEKGIIPIYEPGLATLLQSNLQKRTIRFTTLIQQAIESASCIFICVGTPSQADGAAYLGDARDVAKSIGRYLNGNLTVIVKSTVPLGTTEMLGQVIAHEIQQRDLPAWEYHMVSNPEFLREGSAIQDFMHPSRIVIGSNHSNATQIMKRVYAPLLEAGFPCLEMDIASAEMTKYVANAMLASRISFMNEMARLCEACGADIEQIRRGISHDERIGHCFLTAGIGYGGSCFPKDIQALRCTASLFGIEMPLVHAIEHVNQTQNIHLASKVWKFFHEDLSHRKLAIWGLAFKPYTDDVRESPAIATVRWLIERGATIQAHDPQAMANAREVLGTCHISYLEHPEEALEQADGLLLLCDWKAYEEYTLHTIKQKLKLPVLFDGRQFWQPREVQSEGMIYIGIGRHMR